MSERVSQKRLLIVTQHIWPEQFRINDMINGFLADGIAVDVLCGLPNYPHGEWFEGYTAKGPLQETYHGANLYRCHEVPRRGNTSLRIFLNYLSFPITASLRLHQLPGHYDAVLCYNTSPVLMSFPAILAAHKFKAPLTNYLLDLWPENLYSVLNIQNKFLRRVASWVSDWHYRHAERMIVLSAGVETRLRARIGSKNTKECLAREKRYTVIPQYCEDFYDYTTLPAEAATAPDPFATSGGKQAERPFTLLFAGNFSPAQSLDTMLNALALCKKQGATLGDGNTCPALRFILVGDGMSRPTLQAQVEALGLGDWVQFFGSVSPQEIPALAAKADALLVSLSDSADLGLTIPAKLASCMAAGKPLLVAMNGEGARVATESNGALVSAAADATALAQNLEVLACMPTETRVQMGQNAHAYYKKHFNRSALLAEIEAFLFAK